MKPVKRFEFGEMLTADRFNEMVDAINLLIGTQGTDAEAAVTGYRYGGMTPEQEYHFNIHGMVSSGGILDPLGNCYTAEELKELALQKMSKWSIPPVCPYVRDLKTGEPYPDDMSPAAVARRATSKAYVGEVREQLICDFRTGEKYSDVPSKQDDEWNDISSSLGF